MSRELKGIIYMVSVKYPKNSWGCFLGRERPMPYDPPSCRQDFDPPTTPHPGDPSVHSRTFFPQLTGHWSGRGAAAVTGCGRISLAPPYRPRRSCTGRRPAGCASRAPGSRRRTEQPSRRDRARLGARKSLHHTMDPGAGRRSAAERRGRAGMEVHSFRLRSRQSRQRQRIFHHLCGGNLPAANALRLRQSFPS